MPLTAAQAIETNIMNSLSSYIATNIVTPYNAAVSATTYPNPLGIILEKPSDPQQQPVLPLIVLHYSTEDKVVSTGIGDGTLWQYETFVIGCYPALDTSNSPVAQAAATLRSLVKYALGTALFIPIIDYTLMTPIMVENMQVMSVRLTKASGNMDPIFGMDRYRFDYTLNCRIPVVAING